MYFKIVQQIELDSKEGSGLPEVYRPQSEIICCFSNIITHNTNVNPACPQTDGNLLNGVII